MSSPAYRQLEIRWIDLELTRGSETRKKRPCVIIQDIFYPIRSAIHILIID